MANIYEIVTAENVVLAFEGDTNRPPYEGEIFFPHKRQKGLKFSLVKGKQGLPVALVSSNFDANVLYRDRIGVQALEGKLPFFKEAIKVDEETRQDLLTCPAGYEQFLIKNIFDDTNELLDGAEVSMERMRMQLLSQGTIAITENGVNKEYDYGFDSSSQLKTASTLWSASGSNPLKELSSQVVAYKTLTHKKAAYVLMSDELFTKYLWQDATVLSYFAKLSTPNMFPTEDQVKAYVEAVLGVTVILLDKQYVEARDTTKAAKYFYPTDRFTILPAIDLGNSLYGTTPEEADLIGGQSQASSVQVTEKGVAVTTWKLVDPVNVNTKVSEVCIPTCENIDLIYIVKVLSA